MRLTVWSVLSLAGFIIPLWTSAASFDCRKAVSVSEMLICNDAELSRLDEQLNAVYLRAKAKAADQKFFRLQSESAWKWREANCQTKECLSRWFAARKDFLSKAANEAVEQPLIKPSAANRAEPAQTAAPAYQADGPSGRNSAYPKGGEFDAAAGLRAWFASARDWLAAKGATTRQGETAPFSFIPRRRSKLANDAISALKKLQARTEIGISYRDYAPALGEAYFPVKRYLESEDAKASPQTANSVRKASHWYRAAEELWELSILRGYLDCTADKYDPVGRPLCEYYPELFPGQKIDNIWLKSGVSAAWANASEELERTASSN